MKENDGGPAFPHPTEGTYSDVGTGRGWNPQTGMSLRDYFAAAAMHGLLANPQTPQNSIFKDADGWNSPERICDMAYVTADAMLKAREA